MPPIGTTKDSVAVAEDAPGVSLPHMSTTFSCMVGAACSGPRFRGVASAKASALVVPGVRFTAGCDEIGASGPFPSAVDQTAKVCAPRPAGESGGRPAYVKTTFSPGWKPDGAFVATDSSTQPAPSGCAPNAGALTATVVDPSTPACDVEITFQ